MVVWDECGRVEKGTHIKLFSSMGSLPFLFGVVIVSVTAFSTLTAALSPAWQRSSTPGVLPERVGVSEQSAARGTSLLPAIAGVGRWQQPSSAWRLASAAVCCTWLVVASFCKVLHRVTASEWQLQKGAVGCK